MSVYAVCRMSFAYDAGGDECGCVTDSFVGYVIKDQTETSLLYTIYLPLFALFSSAFYNWL